MMTVTVLRKTKVLVAYKKRKFLKFKQLINYLMLKQVNSKLLLLLVLYQQLIITNNVKIVIIHSFEIQVGLAPLIQDLLRLEMSILIPEMNKFTCKLKKWVRLIFQIILCLEIQFILLSFKQKL